MPREHGVYAQLALPVLTGWLLGGPSVVGGLITLAATLAFLANEPATVLAGRRGQRAARELGVRARTRLRWLLIGMLVFGALALWLGSAPVRYALLVSGVFATGLVPVVWHGRQKLLATELLMTVTFSSLLLPIALAGGGALAEAVIAVVMWSVTFGLATLAVHYLKAAHKGEAGGLALRGAGAALAVGVALAGIWAQRMGWPVRPAFIALALPGTLAAGLLVHPVHPKHLKRVGWSLVVADIWALAWLVS